MYECGELLFLHPFSHLIVYALFFIFDSTACEMATRHVRLPSAIPEWLSPICAIIPGQLFAYHLAMAKGHAIDEPRGLSKVTITR